MTRQPITPEQWAEAKAIWEADEKVSYGDVGDSLGISKQAVAKRAKAENWQRKMVRQKVIDKAYAEADRRTVGIELPKATFSVSGAKEAAPVDAAPDVNRALVERVEAEEMDGGGLMSMEQRAEQRAIAKRAEILTLHRNETNALRKNTYDSIKQKDFNLGKAAKVQAEAMQIIHNMERRAWGIDKIEERPPVVIFEREG